MMEKGLVSIILPNYNGGRYLCKSIESVLDQTYTKWELIVVDDGSIDESKDIIDSYKDERIKKVYFNENNHICFALNEGLKVISGEYIARIDSDDIWKPDKLEKQVAFMEKNSEYGACFTYVDLIDENDCIVNGKFEDIYNLFRSKLSTRKEFIHFFIFEGNCLSHPSVLLRRYVIEDVGAYNLAFVQGQDYELWLRIALKYDIFVYPESLVLYRWDTDCEGKISRSTEKNNTRFLNEYFLTVYKFMMHVSKDDFVKYFKDDFICKDAETELELQCEKAFLCLKKSGMESIHLIGIILLEDIIMQKDGPRVLKEKYNFTLKDFYKLNQEHMLNDSVLNNKMNSLVHELGLQKQLLKDEVEKAVQLTRTSYENSHSWRITAPIRRMRKIMKRTGK